MPGPGKKKQAKPRKVLLQARPETIVKPSKQDEVSKKPTGGQTLESPETQRSQPGASISKPRKVAQTNQSTEVSRGAEALTSPAAEDLLKSQIKIYWSGRALPNLSGYAYELAFGSLEAQLRPVILSQLQRFPNHVPATWEEAKCIIDYERSKPVKDRNMVRAYVFLSNMKSWGPGEMNIVQTRTKLILPLKEYCVMVLPAVDLPPTVFNKDYNNCSDESWNHSDSFQYHLALWSTERRPEDDILVAMSYWVCYDEKPGPTVEEEETDVIRVPYSF